MVGQRGVGFVARSSVRHSQRAMPGQRIGVSAQPDALTCHPCARPPVSSPACLPACLPACDSFLVGTEEGRIHLVNLEFTAK